jgi:hypothetical protein
MREYKEGRDYIIAPDTGCWDWQRSVTRDGYPHTCRPAGTSGYIHRIIWEGIHGGLPDGLILDHLCRNRKCVNPGHLEAVPQAVNVQRGHRAILDWERVDEIRQLGATLTMRQIAERFGISDSLVFDVLHERRWHPRFHPCATL